MPWRLLKRLVPPGQTSGRQLDGVVVRVVVRKHGCSGLKWAERHLHAGESFFSPSKPTSSPRKTQGPRRSPEPSSTAATPSCAVSCENSSRVTSRLIELAPAVKDELHSLLRRRLRLRVNSSHGHERVETAGREGASLSS